jgi:uncharacterized protein
MRFYGELFGWEFVGPGVMPGDPSGEYFVARLHGHDVAGIGSQPAPETPNSPVWNTYVSVTDADDACGAVSSAGGAVLVAPFDAPPAGRMAVASDPSGGTFCIWEATERAGAQLINAPGAWAMSTLLTRDADGAKQFYGDVFGWHSDTFAAGETSFTLWRMPGYVGGEPQQPVPRDVVGVMAPTSDDAFPAGAPPHWSVDFWIGDADAAAAKTQALGGSIVVAPHSAPGFRRCVLADPQGAVFSLSQLVGF